jgi:hypothetical protein
MKVCIEGKIEGLAGTEAKGGECEQSKGRELQDETSKNWGTYQALKANKRKTCRNRRDKGEEQSGRCRGANGNRKR